jgi:hypothetical protein
VPYNDFLFSMFRLLNLAFCPCLLIRMRIQPCGFMGLLVREQFLHFRTHITASRGRTNSLAGIGRVSSNRSILVLLVTQISIILKLGYQLNISSKILGMDPLGDLKANHRSSLNRYGKTTTNLSPLLVFQGLVVSVKVVIHRHSAL